MREIIIDGDLVHQLRDADESWTSIATQLEVSTKTLSRWRKETGFEEPLGEMNDEDIDKVVSAVSNMHSDTGERMLAAHFVYMGVKISRQRLRDSVGRVDPEGRAHRQLHVIDRRQYAVAGVNHLWHVDGHHKLIKYGIVTHGCIDGFSRRICFLKASTNNRASTVMKLFNEAVAECGLPSRVRGDKGGENVAVCDFMNLNRGFDRSSYIGGSSKHNTRIERLWRDVMTQVIRFYKILFTELEEQGMDTEDAVHVYVLQYLFVPRICEDLNRFRGTWYNHKLSTESSATPRQLMLRNRLV